MALAVLPAALRRVVEDGAGWPVQTRPQSPPGMAELQPDLRERCGVATFLREYIDMKIAFLGAGKMATAIVQGLVNNGVWPAADIMAADPATAARTAFTTATGVPCEETALDIVKAADILVIAVKPQVLAEAIRPLRDSCDGKLVVSIAAGIRLSHLAEWCGHRRLVRVMPNTPMMVGRGAAVFCPDTGVTPADKQLVERIFASVGIVVELPEENMDAVTALSGSGPAYIFETIQALVNGAVELGIPAETALALTTQTVAGAAEMVARKMGTPDQLRDAVTSPGGTTAAGLRVFQQAGYRKLIKAVLAAARRRSQELGQALGR